MGKKKEVRLHKIPLGPFLDALLELFEEGLEYVDIVGMPDEVQDTIGIVFSPEYMSKRMLRKYENIKDEAIEKLKDEISKKIDLSDNNDLNQLI